MPIGLITVTRLLATLFAPILLAGEPDPRAGFWVSDNKLLGAKSGQFHLSVTATRTPAGETAIARLGYLNEICESDKVKMQAYSFDFVCSRMRVAKSKPVLEGVHFGVYFSPGAALLTATLLGDPLQLTQRPQANGTSIAEWVSEDGACVLRIPLKMADSFFTNQFGDATLDVISKDRAVFGQPVTADQNGRFDISWNDGTQHNFDGRLDALKATAAGFWSEQNPPCGHQERTVFRRVER